MARQKLKNRNIRKLQNSKGTYYVSIPLEIVKQMKLKERERVIFKYDKTKKRIIIKDYK